jgi:hypothetical protein
MLNDNYDELEWGKNLEAFFISKEDAFETQRKMIHFAQFVRWTGLPGSLMDMETLENTYELWLEAQEGQQQFQMYASKVAEA